MLNLREETHLDDRLLLHASKQSQGVALQLLLIPLELEIYFNTKFSIKCEIQSQKG